MTTTMNSSSLRRRNSMTAPILSKDLHIPSKLQSSSFPPNNDKSSFSAIDLELISLKSLAYTSLKDLLPSLSAMQSPTGGACSQSIYEIPIRNHLVKQAAWAYLQPMSSSPGSSARYSFRRMWARFSTEYVTTPVNACFQFINRYVVPMITRAFNRFVGAIWVKINFIR